VGEVKIMWPVTSACCNVISTLLVTTGTDWAADVGSDMGLCLFNEWRNTPFFSPALDGVEL